MNIGTVKLIIKKPSSLIAMLGEHGLLNWMPDETYLSILSRGSLGYKINLEQPKTFNEKLQWLKLHDRNPLYTQLVDKYEVRKFVAEKIGEEHLIPLLGGPWDSVDEIDFDALPEQFVLKTTHDCGGIVICTNKGSFDREAAKAKLAKHLKRKYYCGNREWPYKNVKPRIIAEQYMVDDSGTGLRDYKFYCFNGEPKFMLIATDRFEKDTETKFTYFDMDFNRLPFSWSGPIDSRKLEKPSTFNEMREIAEKLSAGISHVRVDLYESAGKVFFGELTFYDSSGTEKIDPHEWDEIIGSWLELPEPRS